MNKYKYKDIVYGEMISSLAKSGQLIINGLSPQDAHNWHMASCLVGEMGELLEALSGKTVEIKEELGDAEFYFEGLMQGYGIHLAELGGEEMPNDACISSSRCFNYILIAACNVFNEMKRDVIYRKTLDRSALIHHMSHLRNGLDELMGQCSLTREMVLNANIDKLAGGPNPRYKGGVYSDKAAQERADKVPANG